MLHNKTHRDNKNDIAKKLREQAKKEKTEQQIII